MNRRQDQVAVKHFLNFFFLLFLDEDLAIECTSKALKVYSKSKKKNDIALHSIISAMHVVGLKYRKKFTSFRSHIGHGANIQITVDVPFAKWLEVQRTLTFEELEILIWREVQGFSIQDISAAISLTQGTLKFRLNQALLDLCQNESL